MVAVELALFAGHCQLVALSSLVLRRHSHVIAQSRVGIIVLCHPTVNIRAMRVPCRGQFRRPSGFVPLGSQRRQGLAARKALPCLTQ